MDEEMIFTVPLRKVKMIPRTRRAPAAIKLIRAFLIKNVKNDDERITEDDIWIDETLNEKIWERGIQKPPRKIKIKVVKTEDEIFEVKLAE